MLLETAVVFFLILSVLVLIHELGHFLMAKKFGMYVEEFGFGLPPRIWGKRIGETLYSINWLPIGGFVKLYGENNEEGEKENPVKVPPERAFYNQRKWKRALVLLAGVTMNFLLAWVVISFIFTRGVFAPAERVHIEEVIANSPAAKAGFKNGDIINTINGKRITTPEDLIASTKKLLGKPVRYAIIRQFPSGKVELSVIIATPRKDYPKDQGPLGIAISNLEEKKYLWYQAPFYGLKEAFLMSWEMLKGLGNLVWRLVRFAEVPKDAAGPLGIAQVTGQAVKVGWMAVLQLLGLLSLNLALVNVLPIPALDGGRLAFVFLEKIIGKKAITKIENTATQIGMFFLLTLIVLVTLNDVVRIYQTTTIGHNIQKLFSR